MRATVAAVAFAAATAPPALALEIGARFPALRGETLVVRNDGGIRNATNQFPYGSICELPSNLLMFLVVTRIVGDSVLLTVDLNIALADQNCPHGTETSLPYAQARQRYDDHVRALDANVFDLLR
jgi:hypothetical protein